MSNSAIMLSALALVMAFPANVSAVAAENSTTEVKQTSTEQSDKSSGQSTTSSDNSKPSENKSTPPDDNSKPPEQKTPPDDKVDTRPAASDLQPIKVNWGRPEPKPEEKEKPPPKGQAAAIKLYSASKFGPAAAQFESFIKDGSADVNTHAYLAYCLYSLRQYRKALMQFDWVAKNSTHHLSLQRSAENSAQTLRKHLSGICPGNCLKANDPRWQTIEGKTGKWIKWSSGDGGYSAFSFAHVGEVVDIVKGAPMLRGACPICAGTGRVTVLKDGDPLPK